MEVRSRSEWFFALGELGMSVWGARLFWDLQVFYLVGLRPLFLRKMERQCERNVAGVMRVVGLDMRQRGMGMVD